jgi:hypothetical protein
MLRSLLAACSILVLLTSTILFPTTGQACPVKFPETLLSLYRNSDAIYVARYDKTVDDKVVEDTDARTVMATLQHFDISSALKGENRKLFVLEETDYRYKNVEPNTEEVELQEEEEAEEDALYRRPELKQGDTVLLFLSVDKDDKTKLELTDYRDAIKKMSAERLAAYEARIAELNSIFSAKKVDDAAILDWLIKCTQDPLTRWEGAYELQRGYDRMVWQDRLKEEEKANTNENNNDEQGALSGDTRATGVNIDPIDKAEDLEIRTDDGQQNQAGEDNGPPNRIVLNGETGSHAVDTTVYARLITEDKKQLLTETFLNSANGPNDKKKVGSMTAGDQALLELVANWGDTRLAKFLLEKIQVAGDDGYVISQLMSTAAELLKDDELDKIAQDYSDASYQGDDEVVEGPETAEEETDRAEDSAEAAEEESEIEDAVEVAVDEGSAEREADAPKKMTYKELRAQLFAQFLAQSSIAMANAEAKHIAKAGH